jgi:predicted TIM-barrel fold metal-dependent hydrolase
LSMRSSNVRTYIEAFSPDDGSFGIDMVLGALVDFDYWLDCPPRSAHNDQVALHQHLAMMHGGYLQPVVAYNPWTDIEQKGAGRQRVHDAWETGMFVAAKIYPPTGFMVAGNATTTVITKKRRPDLQLLDDALGAFFTLCAKESIPVIAHAAHTNGRDAAHDDFSGPDSWERLLRRVAADAKTPIISLGHFGGDDPAPEWTRQFANLMKDYPKVQLFGDLGYWERLMCDKAEACGSTRNRLKDVLPTPVGEAEAVVDRVMFATDWLMLSQVSNWKMYPQRVREGLETITESADVAKILGGNAQKCFPRIVA